MNLDLGFDRSTQIMASVGACVLGSLARWFGHSSTEPVFPDNEADPPELLTVEVPPWLEDVAPPRDHVGGGLPLWSARSFVRCSFIFRAASVTVELGRRCLA